MKILAGWIKFNAAILEPIFRLIGLTAPLPDWLAIALLFGPIVVVGMLYPVGTIIVCGLLVAAFFALLVDMLRTSRI